MTALGLWEISADTLLFNETVRVEVYDNNGSYAFHGNVHGFDLSEVNIVSLREEDNIIDAVVDTPVLPGKEISLHAEINGDTVTGYAVFPLIGKVKIKNGRRITKQ